MDAEVRPEPGPEARPTPPLAPRPLNFTILLNFIIQYSTWLLASSSVTPKTISFAMLKPASRL
eukprot:5214747-Amphidinium_carterae.1